MAQIGKHFKVIELLSEKYKCQTQLALLSMQVHTYVRECSACSICNNN